MLCYLGREAKLSTKYVGSQEEIAGHYIAEGRIRSIKCAIARCSPKTNYAGYTTPSLKACLKQNSMNTTLETISDDFRQSLVRPPHYIQLPRRRLHLVILRHLPSKRRRHVLPTKSSVSSCPPPPPPEQTLAHSSCLPKPLQRSTASRNRPRDSVPKPDRAVSAVLRAVELAATRISVPARKER